jgi:hypothetical protein
MPKANKELRGEAFGVIEKIGGHEAQKGLAARHRRGQERSSFATAPTRRPWRLARAEAIVPALQAFSGKLSFKREDVVDFLVKDISKLGVKAKPQVLAALASSVCPGSHDGDLGLGGAGAGEPERPSGGIGRRRGFAETCARPGNDQRIPIGRDGWHGSQTRRCVVARQRKLGFG